ncbi:SusC/RagA family TonB-linked outer membrane protein [Pedobacter sp. GR22-6]|uniref:SusC/RagA family TonB-linked outer membrane protein n=1 Tax=Pedobacter sp. GR22-6 TaxID=3127957 RepID=UPI00307E5A79
MNFSAIAAKYGDGYVCRIPTKILIDFMRITSFIILTITISAQMLIASNVKGQQMEDVRVKLKLNRESLSDALEKIEKQTPFHFLYRSEEIREIGKLNLVETTTTLDRLLQALLANSSLGFKQVNRHIVITKKSEITSTTTNEQNVYTNSINTARQEINLTGKVVDENNVGIPGASVWLVGTKIGSTTNSVGNFSLRVPDSTGILEIRYVGYKDKRISIKSGAYKLIQLEVDQQNLDEVVINNGLFDRKVGSITGAVSTFTGAQLKVVTNQNILKGLAILDPSFQIVENNNFGSDPNRLPDIQLRGQTGIPDPAAEYANQPNQPLFILDGFEATLQRVYDLDINLIKSVVLLKDASAKAIYGAKAGNGVVVIETIRPEAGALRVSYRGSLNLTAPDLSSYHLTNSLEKVEAERLSGKYTNAFPAQQAALTRQYAQNLKAGLDGVDTYWLSQPLQNGYGQQHSLNMDGGDEAMRYAVNLNYNNITGVMKGSDRSTLTGSVNLQYRLKDFAFNNILTIDNNKAVNSPYGSFGDYAKMNPYWQIYDASGAIIPSYQSFGITVFNPLYNATLNTKDFSTYRNVTENFYTEWSPQKNLRFTGRVGITSQNNTAENFLPANHTNFLGIQPNTPEYQNRGRYSQTNGKQTILSSDLGASYNLLIGKHQIFANAIGSINSNSTANTGFVMVGFPDDNIDDIAFGNQYAPGSKASGTENTVRTVALTGAVNYSYDNRFLADVSYRNNASSQFGVNNRWGSFSSLGLGWNLHNEEWLKSLTFVDQLKLRGSIGNTGSPVSNGYLSVATYQYVTTQNYNGDIALQLMAMPNENLKWQKVLDKNIGLDMFLFKRLSFRFDYFIKDTKGLLTDQFTPPSLGFDSYKENIGEVRNKGYQAGINMSLIAANRRSLSVFLNVAHQTNKIRKVSESIMELNRANDNAAQRPGETLEQRRLRLQRPYARYVPNQSMSTIWAVPSLGIDPSNGREIYLKADGTQTYVYSTDDLVNSGDSNPSLTGTFGANMRLGKFTSNFAFTFRTGGQQYNSTLVQRVENVDFAYNVDVRALEDRWKTPGQAALYKDIADLSTTQLSSRFVQNLDELILSSISLGYEFDKLRFFGKQKNSRVSANVNLNDLARFSTVRTERGLDYPFARTMSLSLQATF